MAVTLVPGGAIERYVKEQHLTPLSNEFGEDSGNVAKCYTDQGIVVWTKEDGQVRLLPFDQPL